MRQMSKQAYKENINQLLEVTDSLLKTRAVMPSLILIYAGIDIMAWLSRDNNRGENQRSDFKIWVNTYLLPNSGLSCEANDLYAARCAILHSYTSESKLSRQGDAKKISYVWGTVDSNELQKYVDSSSQKGKVVAISVDTLFSAFKSGVERFNKVLSKNSSLSKLVSKRTDKFFVETPSELIDKLTIKD
jgi:hypothetical protein